jgi:hypothetical protein
MPPKHLLIAKLVVAIIAGLAVGYGVGVSLQHEAAKGRALTMDQYVADFQRYKGNLESSEIPMAVSLVLGTLMVCGAFALYELFALGVAKAINAFAPSLHLNAHPPAEGS